jgi:hypothetical protein
MDRNRIHTAFPARRETHRASKSISSYAATERVWKKPARRALTEQTSDTHPQRQFIAARPMQFDQTYGQEFRRVSNCGTPGPGVGGLWLEASSPRNRLTPATMAPTTDRGAWSCA